MPQRIKVAVLCGGPSSEWEVSKRSGAQVAAKLPKEKYDAKLIQITQDGRWVLLDRKKAVTLRVFGEDGRVAKSDLLKFDIAFIALHGKFGEDGQVQSILETVGLPYTGSGVMASAIAMNKAKAAELVAAAGVATPKTMQLTAKDLREFGPAERKLAKTLGYPFILKPNESGSSFGVSIVQRSEDFVPALDKALSEDRIALAQEYIKGRELTCGVLGNHDQSLMPLPPVEIISSSEFFDYEAKYDSKETKEICPAQVPAGISKKIGGHAVKAHAALGCDGLTRSDFILSKDKLYFLETNTSPGMTEASLCPKEARALGWDMSEFLDKIVELAREKDLGAK